MAIRQVIECSVCGEQKKETNHWQEVWISERDGQKEFHSRPLPNPADPEHDHVCSHHHALLRYQQYLSLGAFGTGVEYGEQEVQQEMPHAGLSYEDPTKSQNQWLGPERKF